MASIDSMLARLRSMVLVLTERTDGVSDEDCEQVQATATALCAGCSRDISAESKVAMWEVAHQLWCVPISWCTTRLRSS